MHDAIPMLTGHWAALTALILFVVSYVLAIAEEALHLRKSTPAMVAAGCVWVLVALAYRQTGESAAAEELFKHNLLDFAELFLFILAAMTYINTMQEGGIFQALHVWLIRRRFSLRAVFWITGLLAFLISPLADNLTTALCMSAVVVTVAPRQSRFVVPGCINVVVAANAGGAFSPFGDITTLMVWQKGVIPFDGFFALFLPSLVNWLVPAALMSFAIPKTFPEKMREEIKLRREAVMVVPLFVLTIVLAVLAQHLLHLPPVLGMMTGLGLLKVYAYFLQVRSVGLFSPIRYQGAAAHGGINTYKIMEQTEWDTLMFFYGILLCVGGLGAFGYLALASQALYVQLGPSIANVGLGVLSAVIDNIPLMFAVLTMQPGMSEGQWLLVTLATGVGGSLLSIGSAAGVAVMGQARGVYTFSAHLRWSWAIALGYAAGIAVHFILNAESFHQGASVVPQ
ncbi:MAG TPA: sodium:proton antiporter NhaD [Gammaproteobacteria bacterium]|nr:sodium:proton antiporter NhaD [Gammaproteobacteria bacterium]